jgi:hypothetical protein
MLRTPCSPNAPIKRVALHSIISMKESYSQLSRGLIGQGGDRLLI